MSFTFSEQHITDYYHHGYTVLRGILPPSLIRDLRQMTNRAREIARAQHGPQVQRLQPLAGQDMDIRPYHDYAALPELNDALHRILSPAHELAGAERAGVLFEPAEMPSNTGWHRDITQKSSGLDTEEWRRISQDATFFTQVNCALYTDTCTWYVPGSDGRPDVSSEPVAAQNIPDHAGKGYEELERLWLDYCEQMPGAVQLVLEPGDFALYRPNGWHLGNYAPYRIRATIHDSVWKPETRAWYEGLRG